MSEFKPTPEQEDALSALAPLLILAGAGTGKTTVLTHRIARLIAGGKARPDQILALTFAEKAAAEMAERLSALLEERGFGEAGREIHCSTFHSFGLEIIQENALLLGRDGESRVLSTPASWQLLSTIVDDLDFRAIDLTGGDLGKVFGKLLGFFSAAKDHLVSPDELESYLATQSAEGLSPAAAKHWEERLARLRDVAAAYRRYEEAKSERGYLDYGDLISLPIRLLRAHPDVRDRYRQRYPFVFVDEYQDTNHAQRLLLLEMISPDAQVVVIGDDDQSIYGWRGAVIQNILNFPREAPIQAAGASQRFLTVNRRSGPPILDIANQVISRLAERYEKRLGYMDDVAEAQAGHYVAASDEAEGRWIAATIRELKLRPEVEDPTGKKRGYGVFAVLCRKRSLFESVARALEEAGIPYELIGGTGFYGRREIRNVLSYLRVLSDPADNIALARVLQLPPWRIHDRDLFHLSRWARTRAAEGKRAKSAAPEVGQARASAAFPAVPEEPVSLERPLGSSSTTFDVEESLPYRLYDAVAHADSVPGLSPEAPGRLARLRKAMDSLYRAARQVPLSELVERAIDVSGHRLEMAVRGDFESELALLNLQKLVELARQFEAEEGTLDGFVEYVQYALDSGDEENEVRPVDEGSDTVKVMTIHQAKGLEFPVVFLPGLAEGIFPDPRLDDPDRWDQFPEQLRGDRSRYPTLDLRSMGTERQLREALKARKDALREMRLDEERRLFYVAITRAQRALFFSRAHWYFTNTKPRNPSPFWDEVLATGLSRSMGEEEAPEKNPRRLSGAVGTAREGGRTMSLARLLLSPDRADAWIGRVASEMPEEWDRRRTAIEREIAALTERVGSAEQGSPVEVSCTGLVRYAECPRIYRYLHVDLLPERPSPWAKLGSEVHRRIEEEARGELPMADEEDAEEDRRDVDHLAEGERIASVEEMLETYRRSALGRRPPTRVEEAFTLPVNGSLVRGRIDRLDRLPDGGWELVDYKAARFPGQVGRGRLLQLHIYSLAAWRLWGVHPERLQCRLFFLADGHIETLRPTIEDLEQTEEWIAGTIRRIQAGLFPRTQDAQVCARCGYGQVCAAGLR
ncbi:MAG: ATP-dependent helicase [Sphingomonadaceae bacterium]